MDNEILNRAIRFAVEAHRGQLRKDGSPFILHPLEAAAIVGTLTRDPEILAAAVLHDTVEDTDTSPEDILANFGARVYGLVMHETENKRPERAPAETWRVRKEESLQLLAETRDPAVKMLWLGDKLSNLRALYRHYLSEGEGAFNRFNNKDPKAHAWYFGTIRELLSDLADTPAYKEYVALDRSVFSRYE